MRTFYIFNIKKEFKSLFKNNNNQLYEILRHLYYMKNNELNYAYNMIKQLTNIINKDELNKSIFIKYHNNMTYTKNNEQHIINNLYKDEISIMTIKKTYITINVNHNMSSFFSILNKYDINYFICDFKNNDYFWINDIKMLV